MAYNELQIIQTETGYVIFGDEEVIARGQATADNANITEISANADNLSVLYDKALRTRTVNDAARYVKLRKVFLANAYEGRVKELLTKKNMSLSLGKNIFDKTAIKLNYEVYTDGQIRPRADSAASDYMDVEGFESVYISGLTPYATGTNRYCYFYDANKTPLNSRIEIDKLLAESILIVPPNAKYLAFSPYQRKTSTEVINLDTIQVEGGSEKTKFEPYGHEIETIYGYGIKKDAAQENGIKTYGKVGLFFGDSITETATISEDGATYTEGTRSNWPTSSKVELRLGGMWNYARSGASFKDQAVAGDVRKSISQQISLAVSNNRPGDIIVVAAGTNDTTTTVGTYAAAMAKATLADLDRSILYEAIRWAFWTIRINYPNATCYAATPLQRESMEPPTAIRDAIIQMANRYNFIVIDGTYESGITRELAGTYLSDGLHPNTEGKVLQSKLFDRVILNTFNPVI